MIADAPGARPKVLFIAEAVTLAHVGRPLQLASILHQAGFEIELACDERYARFLAAVPFRVHGIRSIPTESFLAALARGRPVYTKAALDDYVAADLALLGRSKPDVVVGDFRLSLSVSARVAGVPYVNVTNAYWSPYARPRFHMPTLAFAPRIGAAIGNAAFRLVRPLAFAAHARPMNRVRRAHGLAPIGRDVRRVYCDGDLTLYADIPELVPTFDAPPSHRHIGVVLWSPPVAPPPWWDAVMAGEPPIYVSLGSSGEAERLPRVVDALMPLGRPLVVATAGRVQLAPRPGLWVADYLPGESIAAKACAVVCNGGSSTTYQALVHGVPVVGIASNLDQYLNMDYIERFGAGVLLRADRAGAAVIRAATRRVLEDRMTSRKAAVVASLAAATRASTAFPAAIRELLDR